jgi:hypothetical protein
MVDRLKRHHHILRHVCPAPASLVVGAVLLFGLPLVVTANCSAQDHGKLQVSKNHRFLEYEDGTAFFYLGDTAWELIHRLDREEAARYLTNRAQKGFTVIQTVVLAQLGGLDVPNAYGDLPLIGKDPQKPNDAYFRHVDYIVNKAEELGLFIGMLPSWGSHWGRIGKKPPYVFTVDNARVYGRFLGKRYRDNRIIWILGGDITIQSDQERAIVDAMAAGLKEGDGGSHLMTYHPRGPGLSSIHLHKADWLDFNMYQSSHGGHDHDNGLFAEHDYALQPPKPTLDGEPRYECIPVGFYFDNFNRYDRFDAYDMRQAAYWSLLAGACGHTYGHNSLWQMWQPGRESRIHADIPWYEAMDHPGASQMRFVRRLFESRPFRKLVPRQDIILNGPKTGVAKIRAARASDGSFAFIYTPRGEKFTVDKNIIKAKRIKEIWYDPRYGIAHHVHGSDNWGMQTYTPPTSGRGNDWILILEDAYAGFPLPGATELRENER